MKIILEGKEYLIESPFVDEMVECLMENPWFNQKVDLIDFFELENDMNFLSSSIRLFSKPLFQGFVKIWVNNLFYNWKLYYIILVDNLMIKITLP